MEYTRPMNRTLYIVSVYRPDLLDELIHAVGVSHNTQVFMDRRMGERRSPERAGSEASRRLDRRTQDVETALRTEGFAVVTLNDAMPVLAPAMAEASA